MKIEQLLAERENLQSELEITFLDEKLLGPWTNVSVDPNPAFNLKINLDPGPVVSLSQGSGSNFKLGFGYDSVFISNRESDPEGTDI